MYSPISMKSQVHGMAKVKGYEYIGKCNTCGILLCTGNKYTNFTLMLTCYDLDYDLMTLLFLKGNLFGNSIA